VPKHVKQQESHKATTQTSRARETAACLRDGRSAGSTAEANNNNDNDNDTDDNSIVAVVMLYYM